MRDPDPVDWNAASTYADIVFAWLRSEDVFFVADLTRPAQLALARHQEALWPNASRLHELIGRDTMMAAGSERLARVIKLEHPFVSRGMKDTLQIIRGAEIAAEHTRLEEIA